LNAITSSLGKARRLVNKSGFPYRAAPTPYGVEPAPVKKTTGSDFNTDWARKYPARLTRAILIEGFMRPAMKFLADPHISGVDRLRGIDGPVIFAANHHSHADTPLLLSTIPDPWRHHLVVGAAADYFFSTRVGGTISSLVMSAVPIERTKVGRRSAEMVRDLIDEGWSLIIFPEGGRSPDGWGQPFRGGAAYLAIRCGVPVVPIHIYGTGKILRKGKSLPRPSSTKITFGDPLMPDEGQNAKRFAEKLETAVAALADEASTDWWQARRRAYSKTSPDLTGPDAGGWRRIWALGKNDRRSQRKLWPDF